MYVLIFSILGISFEVSGTFPLQSLCAYKKSLIGIVITIHDAMSYMLQMMYL